MDQDFPAVRGEGSASATTKSCGSDGEDRWSPLASLFYRFPRSACRSHDSMSGNLAQVTVHESPINLEVEELRSRLDVVTRQLADRDETIDTLSSELATYKALYKETILEIHSPRHMASGLLGPSSPRVSTPECLIPLRASSMRNLRVKGCGLDDDDEPSATATATANTLETNFTVPEAVGGLMGAVAQFQRGHVASRLGRFHSWREGIPKRSTLGVQSPDLFHLQH